MADPLVLYSPRKLTRVSTAVAEALRTARAPIISAYELYLVISKIYKTPSGLYLKKEVPGLQEYSRIQKNLSRAGILHVDYDYHRSFRILINSDSPADDICCLVDPFCYVSHLSAMQRYGITNRRPEALHLTRPIFKLSKQLLHQKMNQDGISQEIQNTRANLLKIPHHPSRVRDRKISLFQTSHIGDSTRVRTSFARVSSIGQTFVDMLDQPMLCGGMVHVLNIWREHTNTYFSAIVDAVDKNSSSIVKVRAGYIIDEVLQISNERVLSWRSFAQRGGSRLLDPTKKYAPKYSERWMISLNV